jgi:hypothetical protein
MRNAAPRSNDCACTFILRRSKAAVFDEVRLSVAAKRL